MLAKKDLAEGEEAEMNHYKSCEILPYVPNHNTIVADYQSAYEKLKYRSKKRENRSLALIENQEKDDRSHKFSFASYVSISSDKVVDGYLKVDKGKEGTDPGLFLEHKYHSQGKSMANNKPSIVREGTEQPHTYWNLLIF